MWFTFALTCEIQMLRMPGSIKRNYCATATSSQGTHGLVLLKGEETLRATDVNQPPAN